MSESAVEIVAANSPASSDNKAVNRAGSTSIQWLSRSHRGW